MDSSTQIGPLLRTLHLAIRQHIDRKVATLDLTSIQSFVLRYLSEHQDSVVYPKDIEKRFHLTHPTVSGILQRLEARDFISILPDPDDRRCHRIALTQRGLQCQQDIQAHVDAMEAAMVRGLSAAEQQTLRRLLGRLMDNMNHLERLEEVPHDQTHCCQHPGI